jgi:hypothetical protein
VVLKQARRVSRLLSRYKRGKFDIASRADKGEKTKTVYEEQMDAFDLVESSNVDTSSLCNLLPAATAQE